MEATILDVLTSLLRRQLDQFAGPSVVPDGEADCFSEWESLHICDLFAVFGIRRSAHQCDFGPSPQPCLLGMRQVGTVRMRTSVSDSDVGA